MGASLKDDFAMIAAQLNIKRHVLKPLTTSKAKLGHGEGL